MRIVYLSNSKIPSKEANSIQVIKMCAAFASLSHQVILFSVKKPEQGMQDEEFYGITEKFERIKIFVPDIPGLRKAWYTLNVLFRLFGQIRPDVFYGRDALSSLAAAVFIARPIILEVHTPPNDFFGKWIIRRLSHMKNFFRLVAISKSLQEYYRELLPELDQRKFIVAPDGADPVDMQRLNPQKAIGREGALQIGYTGHLYAGKGLEVICALAGQMPEVDFHIVGGQEEHIRQWRERCKCSNLYFHGFVPHREVPAYLNQFDILLAPYQRQVAVSGNKGDIATWMSPLKIFEYMSVGKAIICSDLPVLREVLTPEVDCLMVEPDDSQAWAQAIRRLSDRNTRETIGRAAQENFNRRYTWRKRAERVLEGL